MDEIVRPFELDVLRCRGFERRAQRDPDRQRKPREETRALLEAPAERKRKAAAGDRSPAPSAPAAARRLPFGDQQAAMDVAAHRTARSSLLVESTCPPPRPSASRRPAPSSRHDRIALQKWHRIDESIAAAADALELEPAAAASFSTCDTRARDMPDRARQRFAGMQFAVGETAQHREAEGGKHEGLRRPVEPGAWRARRLQPLSTPRRI